MEKIVKDDYVVDEDLASASLEPALSLSNNVKQHSRRVGLLFYAMRGVGRKYEISTKSGEVLCCTKHP